MVNEKNTYLGEKSQEKQEREKEKRKTGYKYIP